MYKNIIVFFTALTVIAAVVLSCYYHKLDLNYFNESDFVFEFDDKGYFKIPSFVARKNADNSISYYGAQSVYGAYLAGRVAHLRQDFDTAAEYYKIVLDKNSDTDINKTTYIILSSLGQIGEAAPYARKEIENGSKNTIAPLIVAISDFSEGKYQEAATDLKLLQDKVYETIVNPLFNAWIYAGQKDEQNAIKSIDKVIDDPLLTVIKKFHKALIYDFLGNREKTAEIYTDIISNHPQDVTYRMLEIITDFYVRGGDKEMAQKISSRYNDNSILSMLLKDIDKKIDVGKTSDTAIIDTPQKGLSEMLFNIGTIFRASNATPELAQIYIAASSYLNPDYDIPRIALANIFEEIGLLKEANRYYEQIHKDSGSYFIVQVKIIENLNNMKEYEKAEQKLKELLKDYPNNTQLLSNLADVTANMNNHKDAIKIYQKALESAKESKANIWPIYYSLAVSYDRNQEKQKAEENLQKALDMSNRNPNVLNYLGYSWLVRNKNIDEAVKMIVEAYKQSPYEGHIIDSLGWVYFCVGQYDKAVTYLEQATDMNPGNAVINDHLGDAYWFSGRKNEAVFQWKHALVLKEDTEILNKAEIKDKISDGLAVREPLKINENTLKMLEDLQQEEF